MESENYDNVFWMPEGTDYKVMAEQAKVRIRPVADYQVDTLNFFVQESNIDKKLMADLVEKHGLLESVAWDDFEDKPIVWTTEDFKSVALYWNAMKRFEMEEEKDA